MMRSKTLGLMAALLMSVSVAAVAGHKGEKCTSDVKTCLKEKAAMLKDRGWVGIEMDEDKDTKALRITRVVAESPAEKAGLRIRYVVETHLHADFVSGHRELAERTGAEIVFGSGRLYAAFDEYAVASAQIAAADMRFATQVEDIDRLVEAVVVGTALGDAELAALRRLAQTDLSARRYGGPGGTG